MLVMDKPCDLHDNLHTLSSILHSHVSETDAQIKYLQQSAQLLARGQEISDVSDPLDSKQKEETGDFGEDALIHELERARLELVMEIQTENYLSQKLKEMVGECEDLVGGVAAYYNGIHESKAREDRALEEHVRIFSDTVVAGVKDTLRSNIVRLDESQAKLYSNAKEVIQGLERDGAKASDPESQQELSRAIDVLNEKFNTLVEKSV